MLVAVTGASGFIAQHIVKLLLEKKYAVVGTVRSEAKGEELARLINDPNFSYEVVPDLGKPNAIDRLLERDITFLLHTAMPFFYVTDDPQKDLIDPAVNGITSIMESLRRNPKIKRLVLTSSDAAIYSAEDEQNPALSFDEDSWNNCTASDNPVEAYYTAKALAEKYVWAFLAREKPFGFVSVNPAYVFGPQAYPVNRALNTSNTVISGLLGGEPFENEKGSFIDVRDVAKAHVFAMEAPEAEGKRLLLTNGHFCTQMIANAINEKWPGLAAKGVEGSEGEVGNMPRVSNERTRGLLGWEFISLGECVWDTVTQLIELRTE